MNKENARLAKHYETIIAADLTCGNIKRDKYGNIKKSMKIQGGCGISVRITGYGATAKECAEKLVENYLKLDSVKNASQRERSFCEVANEWYENSKAHNGLSEENLKNYRGNLKNHIIPYFEERTIGSITPADLQSFLNTFEGQGESHVKKIYDTIKQIIEYAVTNRYVDFPSMYRLVMPNVKPNKARDMLTEDELKKLLKAIPHHKCGTMFLIMLICGLRPSELRRLKWTDIDFERNFLRVRESKTKNGENRIVPIADIGIEYLKALKAEYIRLGKPIEYVFTQPTNMEKPHTKTSFGMAFDSLKRQADILAGATVYRNKIVKSTFDRDFTSYYLRHTFCSFLSLSGTSDYVIKRLMGHSLKDSVTFGIYTHYGEDEILSASKNYLDYVTEKLNDMIELPEAEH